MLADRIIAGLLAFALALFPSLVFAQSAVLNGFPPGTFQSRAAIDAPVASSATLTYEAFATENAGTNTAVFTSVNLGTAASNRVIAVIPMSRATAIPPTTVTSVAFTVGATATLSQVSGAAANPGAGQVVLTDIWYASVPSGTSATITVVWSGTNNRSGIYVYAINTSTPTPSSGANIGTNNVMTLTQSITVPAGGVGIAGWMTQQTGNTDTFTAGATLDNASALAGALNGVAAGHTTATGSVSVTASSTPTGNTMAMSLASWGP